ncbi:YojF family protein [Bacillus carboniphilus]|uniref:YojF family protein n=1 Tax=Bacillus carboniphilus TaxID=86663 RepID=A0ABY9JVA7_9BACI|nr:YojF family protein [Bacillus carboniphilus]WLR43344.1 YojF family protein [Bacillus carboniphilus]
MEQIQSEELQTKISTYINKEVYVHLETTTGAYHNHQNEENMTVVAFIRNVKVFVQHVKVKGSGPYRVGLKMNDGWVYAEGLTHWTIEKNQLLMAGLDKEGRLAIGLQLSETPFE